MKKIILLLSLAFTLLMANATTIVVNNRTDLPFNPGQYTTIQAAITAAVDGDTILVAGSPIQYAGFNISKKVILIGPGYNPDKQNPLSAIINGNVNFTVGYASNTILMGFKIIGSIDFNDGSTYSNVTIRRNIFNILIIRDSTVNLLLAECELNIGTYSGYDPILIFTNKFQKNFIITNNIFISNSSTLIKYGPQVYCGYQSIPPSTYSSIIFDHNLWLNGSSSTPLITNNWPKLGQKLDYGCDNYASTSSVRNMIIKNNIFYNVNGGTDTTSGVVYNHTYLNNITYAGAALPILPCKNSIGSGNKNNIDPQFVSLFNTTNTVDFNLDSLRLKASSPARNAANDGTDIGPTGGSYPIYQSTNQYLTGEPTIPEIKYMNFVGSSATAPGGILQISVKAKKIN